MNKNNEMNYLKTTAQYVQLVRLLKQQIKNIDFTLLYLHL